MPTISIIVPVYNVRRYLNRCVDSILAQTFTDFELLLVDDGSTDGSGALCDEYAAKDSRTRVLHKTNGGLSDARNAGIEAAKGDYLGFIDSDDYIESDMYEYLYGLIRKDNADVAACGMYQCYIDHIHPPEVAQEVLTVNNEQAIALMLDSRKVSVNAVNKLYKRELFCTIRYPVGKLSEDAFIVVELFALTHRVVISTVPKYYYFHHKGTITSSSFRKNDLNVIEAYAKNLKLIKNQFPSLQQQALFRYYFAHFYVLDKMVLTPDFQDFELRKQIVRFLRHHFIPILCNPFVGRNRKIALCGLMINVHIYTRFVVCNRTINHKLSE